MFIDFEKYPFKITGVSFSFDSKDLFDSYSSILTVETDGGKCFVFEACGECCSCSVFRIWENYRPERLIGKTISSIREIDVPDDFEFEEIDSDDDLCLAEHLYEFKFTDSDETFKLLLVNYSNGYYDGWMKGEVIDM